MGCRPGLLCHLQKGKVIDPQSGFVETFNWMVDFINNLAGEKGITINKAASDRPKVGIDDKTKKKIDKAAQSVMAEGSDGITASAEKDGEGNVTITISGSGSGGEGESDTFIIPTQLTWNDDSGHSLKLKGKTYTFVNGLLTEVGTSETTISTISTTPHVAVS